MLIIVGFIVVVGSVLVGFIIEGGHVGALIQPAELLVIGGAAFGAMIVMSSKKTLLDMVKGILQALKGSPYGKAAYEDLFKVMYNLFALARRDGLMGLESHISEPDKSPLFQKYPRITGNHHVLEFICGALAPIIEGTAKPEQLHKFLAGEIKLIEDEHHAPLGVLAKTADGLPGFGIVAAVLGIVITMASIDGPAEEIGEKVGAALVGTFLGILLSYGFIGPLVVKLESLGEEELGFFRTIAAMVENFICDAAPKVAMESARRGVCRQVRPSRERMDELLKEVEVN